MPALVALATATEQLAAAGFPPTPRRASCSTGSVPTPPDGSPNLTSALDVSQAGALTQRELLAPFAARGADASSDPAAGGAHFGPPADAALIRLMVVADGLPR
ncbi:hypothetical protein ACS0ZG_25565 [Burkholderia gladioli]|uniref:hypothetical protein n=1 Tax=Burkholderia gladioli TaxID=28095 RepID=UPI003F7A3057